MDVSLDVIASTSHVSQATPDPQFARPAWAGSGQVRYHTMIKPAGAVCNLDCAYCFYLHKEQLLDQPRQPRMSDDMLRRHIQQYIASQDGDEVVFSWQGGEPTLMGLDFFKRVVELQQQFKKPRQRIENDLQTNGTLLDDAWAAFLKQHGFLVGLSLDGPRELHDLYRVNKGGAPTFDKVFAVAKLLKKYGVAFNALCVVNRENAKRPLEVYRFLSQDLGTHRVQFTPCVESRQFDETAPALTAASAMPTVGSSAARPGNPDSIVTDWSVDPDEWGGFLCRVWDDWLRHDLGKIHVNLFETAVVQSMGMPAQTCTQAPICGKALALEHNGDVYSCDHFVYPQYKLGNIAEQHEGNMALSQPQVKFGFAKRDALPRYCQTCKHLNLCWGECPKNRIVRTPEGEAGLNYLCPGWKRFYSHIARDIPTILRKMREH